MTNTRHHPGLFHVSLGIKLRPSRLQVSHILSHLLCPSMVDCLQQEQLLVGPSGLRAVACSGNVGGESGFHQVRSGMFQTGFSLCGAG